MWREELHSFQLKHHLSDLDLVCMMLEQSIILGGLVGKLLEDLRVDDVLRPMVVNLNGDTVANRGVQRVWNRLNYVMAKSPKDRLELVIRQWGHAQRRLGQPMSEWIWTMHHLRDLVHTFDGCSRISETQLAMRILCDSRLTLLQQDVVLKQSGGVCCPSALED